MKSDSNVIMSQCIQVDNVPIGTLSISVDIEYLRLKSEVTPIWSERYLNNKAVQFIRTPLNRNSFYVFKRYI